MITIEKLEKEVRKIAPKKSAWDKGILLYVSDLLEGLREDNSIFETDLTNITLLDRLLLNGARDWKQYSYSGCSLCYDKDIAKRLCNKSELIQTDFGNKYPNKNENWLDVQARALYQAAALIHKAVHFASMKEDY